MSTVKRVFFYTVSFITLGIFAGGVGNLLSLCFDIIIKGERWAGSAIGQLSLGLSLVIIGGVLWFLFWRAIQKQVSENPEEIGAGIRKLFLNLIQLVTAIVGLSFAADFLRWLISGVPVAQFPSAGLAAIIVTAGIWYYHWWLEEKEGQPSSEAKTLRRWYIYILSGFGLVSLAESLVQLINVAILCIPVWGANVIISRFWDYSVQASLGWIIVGGVTWWFHWFHMAKGDYDSTLRQVYFYLLAIMGGAIAGLVALIMSLFGVIRFAFGGVSTSADIYLPFLAWTIPTMIISAAIWTYHQKAVQEEAVQLPEKKLSARRVYLYIMSFLGLGTLIGGLSILIGILLNLWINAAGSERVFVETGWWRNELSICLALLIVGTPIWLFYWNRVLTMTLLGGVVERGAMSRRIFLYIVLGVAVILLVADLVNIIYQLLNGLLQGMIGVHTLRNMVWSLQTLLLPVPVLLYHWRVLRQDQRLGAEKLPQRKTVTILAGEMAAELISRIEEKLGSRIRKLRNITQVPEDIPALSDEEVVTLINNIQEAPSNKVLLVVTGSKVMVIPYQEK
jgi:hypothetical protein